MKILNYLVILIFFSISLYAIAPSNNVPSGCALPHDKVWLYSNTVNSGSYGSSIEKPTSWEVCVGADRVKVYTYSSVDDTCNLFCYHGVQEAIYYYDVTPCDNNETFNIETQQCEYEDTTDQCDKTLTNWGYKDCDGDGTPNNKDYDMDGDGVDDDIDSDPLDSTKSEQCDKSKPNQIIYPTNISHQNCVASNPLFKVSNGSHYKIIDVSWDSCRKKCMLTRKFCPKFESVIDNKCRDATLKTDYSQCEEDHSCIGTTISIGNTASCFYKCYCHGEDGKYEKKDIVSYSQVSCGEKERTEKVHEDTKQNQEDKEEANQVLEDLNSTANGVDSESIKLGLEAYNASKEVTSLKQLKEQSEIKTAVKKIDSRLETLISDYSNKSSSQTKEITDLLSQINNKPSSSGTNITPIVNKLDEIGKTLKRIEAKDGNKTEVKVPNNSQDVNSTISGDGFEKESENIKTTLTDSFATFYEKDIFSLATSTYSIGTIMLNLYGHNFIFFSQADLDNLPIDELRLLFLLLASISGFLTVMRTV